MFESHKKGLEALEAVQRQTRGAADGGYSRVIPAITAPKQRAVRHLLYPNYGAAELNEELTPTTHEEPRDAE